MSRQLCAIWRDDDVQGRMIEAWVISNPRGPVDQKNEHGFWIYQNGADYSAGPMLYGYRNFIPGILESRHGSSIFYHVHPFTQAEGFPELGGWDAGFMRRNPGIYYIIFGYTSRGPRFQEFDLRGH